MTPQFIFAILCFVLILLTFKMIYLERNPFQMTRFWMVQIGVGSSVFFIKEIGFKSTIVFPYIISFLLILILFKIFNWKKNPFKMIRFWVTAIMSAIIVTGGIFFMVMCALGGKDFPEGNLVDDIELETITSITIIQRKDTVHLDSIYPFVYKLDYVHHVTGPVKYPNMGKIIFIRKDGSKDSINTNGYGYGPYKDKWYMSGENVLEEYFKK